MQIRNALACVATVSVWFRSKERGTRVKDRAKNDANERAGRVEEERKETVSFLRLLFPPLLFFVSRFICRAVKTENPLPWSFFAPKPNGNACYAS